MSPMRYVSHCSSLVTSRPTLLLRTSFRPVRGSSSALRQIHRSTVFNAQQPRRKGSENDRSGQSAAGDKRKLPRTPAGNASLRRTASHGVYTAGSSDQILTARANAGLKTITAFCAAEAYNMERVATILKNSGYVLDLWDTKLFPQVIHLCMPSRDCPEDQEHKWLRDRKYDGDAFVFPSGTVVAWDVDEQRVQHLIAGALRYAAINAHPELIETEDLGYYEEREDPVSTIVGDTIKLGTRPLYLDESHFEEHIPGDDIVKQLSCEEQREHGLNLTLAKIAFSSGLARSTKIAVLETLLDRYFESTQHIPTLLASGQRLPFSRKDVLRRTGELLSVRARLNLTELTDKLPDLFWDSRHELGLEEYFNSVGKALDTYVRIRTLNERMDYAQEIATILRENLSEKHSLLLEWLIIGLIALEVGVEGWHLYGEWKAKSDPNSTENLMHAWLMREMSEKNDRP